MLSAGNTSSQIAGCSVLSMISSIWSLYNIHRSEGGGYILVPFSDIRGRSRRANVVNHNALRGDCALKSLSIK